jgi:major vault protein
LKIENNKVSDCITAQTKDFVTVQIKLAYTVNFLSDYKDKWFAVNNYVKYLCDYERSALKRMIKEYTIEEFYSKAAELIRNCVLDIDPEAEAKDSKYTGKVFEKNGMNVVDVEVVNVAMDRAVADIMERSQADAIRRNLALSEATEKMEIEKKLAEYAKTEATLKHQNEMYKLELQKKSELERLAVQTSIKAKERAEIEAAKQAEADLQKVIDLVEAAKLARDKKHDEARIETEKALAAIEKDKQDAYAETVAKIMESVTPDLIAALSTKANADLLTQATKSMSPYAIANGESVAETVDKLMRGTTLEGILTKVAESK